MQSLAPAEEGTFSVSVHGTLLVVLYTDRHSHRKDVPESVSSLGVCSPFFWCGDNLSFSYSLVMRKKLYVVYSQDLFSYLALKPRNDVLFSLGFLLLFFIFRHISFFCISIFACICVCASCECLVQKELERCPGNWSSWWL